MAIVYFEKVSEHFSEDRGVKTIIWRVNTLESEGVQGDKEYYIKASKIHKSLRGQFWANSRDLIAPDKVFLSDRIPTSGKEAKRVSKEPGLYQQIECGGCGRINLVSLDKLPQGACYCTACKITICIIIGTRINCKNGSKGLNTQRGV